MQRNKKGLRLKRKKIGKSKIVNQMKIIKHISILFFILTTSIAFAQIKFEAKPNNEELKDEIFIITELSKTDIAISDSIVVRYKLYVSQSTGVNSWNEADQPIFKDFDATKTELGQMNIAYENYKGERYRIVILKGVNLKPNKTGNLEIPEYTLNLQISTPSKPNKDSDIKPKLEEKDITIVTNKIDLTVK